MRTKVFEQSLGVVLKCAFTAVEALQTLDITQLLEHVAMVLKFAVENIVCGLHKAVHLSVSLRASVSPGPRSQVAAAALLVFRFAIPVLLYGSRSGLPVLAIYRIALSCSVVIRTGSTSNESGSKLLSCVQRWA